MKKILLILTLLFSISSKHIYAESPYKTGVALTVTALIAGGTLQTVKFICEQDRYKYIGRFIYDYPGVALACAGTMAGFGLIFKHTVADSVINPIKELIVSAAAARIEENQKRENRLKQQAS